MDTKDQNSLLLFLETQIVEHHGRVSEAHMNQDDIQQAYKWHDEKLISFGRIASQDCNEFGCIWVTFSDNAWKKAHQERRLRGERMLKSKRYETTAEKRELTSG